MSERANQNSGSSDGDCSVSCTSRMLLRSRIETRKTIKSILGRSTFSTSGKLLATRLRLARAEKSNGHDVTTPPTARARYDRGATLRRTFRKHSLRRSASAPCQASSCRRQARRESVSKVARAHHIDESSAPAQKQQQYQAQRRTRIVSVGLALNFGIAEYGDNNGSTLIFSSFLMFSSTTAAHLRHHVLNPTSDNEVHRNYDDSASGRTSGCSSSQRAGPDSIAAD